MIDKKYGKPLLVGEANPYGPGQEFALYPHPEGSAGHRLATKILGLTRKDYLTRYDRANLCETKWSTKEARAEAQRLVDAGDHETFVLFGAKVTSAFLPGAWKPFRIEQHCAGAFVVLPHPSGLSRGWDPDHEASFERARALLREVGAL